MFARGARAFDIGYQRGPHAADFIGDYRHAYAAFAYQYAARKFFLPYCSRDEKSVFWVIARFGRITSEILYLISFRLEIFYYLAFEIESAVVGAYSYPHIFFPTLSIASFKVMSTDSYTSFGFPIGSVTRSILGFSRSPS